MLKVNNLCKTYPSFQLKNVSFELDDGYIMGFIGNNGAGKTTTLKSILNIVHPDSGEVEIFGKPIKGNETELKQQISFSLGPVDYYPHTKISKLAKIISRFYNEWDDDAFSNYLKRFHIDPDKRVSELSTGMSVKLAMAFSLSHNSKLFMFDEPTSGLDPIARDELLDLFREIVEDGKKSILFSTHITSDLDKCADYIIFIRNGELIARDTKDDLIDKHALVVGECAALTDDLKSRLVSYKINHYEFSGLITRDKLLPCDSVKVEVPNLEDLMIYYNKF